MMNHWDDQSLFDSVNCNSRNLATSSVFELFTQSSPNWYSWRKTFFREEVKRWNCQIYVEAARFFPEHFNDVLNINPRIIRGRRNARSIMLCFYLLILKFPCSSMLTVSKVEELEIMWQRRCCWRLIVSVKGNQIKG